MATNVQKMLPVTKEKAGNINYQNKTCLSRRRGSAV